MNGFVLLDKPTGMTSRQAGGRVARLFGQKKFGHIGTLDPMASGLLVIALGEATKMIPFLENREQGTENIYYKEYLFSIRWGIRTDTGDITGRVLEEDNYELGIMNYELEKIVSEFPKEYDQMPPVYSAKKVGGVAAYKLAREGREVALKAKRVKIYELKVVAPTPAASPPPLPKGRGIALWNNPLFLVRCSQGTYVRSLVQDIAERTGKIATCDMIRRTATNGFSVENAVPLEIVENMCNNSRADEIIHPLDFGLDDILVAKLETKDASAFSNGGFISFNGNGIRRVYSDDNFIGIGEIKDGVLKPKRVVKTTP
ncbi:MAG: tRNA pseudouridine(55) synthase TruB [Rickettsiales bacterium]|jgi:tRNA pseudouridine55 synthase|nr:tRNA pseudouridine(55) synthase TruB [Rickettsiales bacterium]